MAEELIGNCLVAQSGGPTAVINASVAGVVSEALNHECIEEVYGGINGVLGILKEEIIDLAEESQQNIRGLRYTPASALGTAGSSSSVRWITNASSRFLKPITLDTFSIVEGMIHRIPQIKFQSLLRKKDYALRVIGVPKTIDNDLVLTDHCPGYGSVVKYLCTIIRETALDHEAMCMILVSIIEVMGRNAGWIALGTTLAKSKENPNDAPHLIYLPELPFSKDKFVDDVQRVLKKNKYCLVVVGEELIDKDGNYVANSASGQDAFGHQQLGGVGRFSG